MNGPKVSVIIPTYNRALSVAEAVNSVLQQAYRDFEVIVVDDGSTDETPVVLGNFGDRIRTIRQANSGVSAARNAGIRAAQGEWVALLDSDDLWLPEKLTVQMRDVAAHPGVVGHMMDALIIGYSADPISLFEMRGCREEFRRRPFRSRPLLDVLKAQFFTSTWLFHRATLEACGLFQPRLTLWEDLDVLARMALRGPFVVSADAGARMRRVPSQTETVSDRHVKLRSQSLANLCEVYEELLNLNQADNLERRVLRRELSGSRYELAATLAAGGEKSRARRLLWQSVSDSPGVRSFLRACASQCAGYTFWNHLTSRLKTAGTDFRRSERDAAAKAN